MSDIERLILQLEQLGNRRRMETISELCEDYTDYSPNTKKLWVVSFLKCLEEQRFGSLLSDFNEILLFSFQLLVGSLNTLNFSENSSIIHKSIDSILTRELKEIQNLEGIQNLLYSVSNYQRSNEIKFKYYSLAIKKISNITFETLMNPNKTIEDIKIFLAIYSKLVPFIEISELSWSVIFKICEFIEKELVENNRREILSECFLVLFTIADFCVNQIQSSEIELLLSEIQPLLQIREPNSVVRISDPVVILPSDLRQVLNLDQISSRETLFANRSSELIKTQVDRVIINNQKMILKIYEIPAARIQDLQRIYREARVYEKLSNTNHKSFLKYYGINFKETESSLSNVSMVTLTLGIEDCRASLGNWMEERIAGRIKFTSQEIAKTAYELISGFLTMRDLGVIHQDIKPENIMIGSDNHMKIIDFDVSYVKVSGVTFTGKKICLLEGTQGYYSPEKLKCHYNRMTNAPLVNYDPEYSDIFSLGLVFYQMITLTAQILYQNISNLHDHLNAVGHIDQNIIKLVIAMLAENPNDRVNFATALSMVPYREDDDDD